MITEFFCSAAVAHRRHGSPNRFNRLGSSSRPAEAAGFQAPSFSVFIAVVILITANPCGYPDILLQCRSANSSHGAMEIAPGVRAGGRPGAGLGTVSTSAPLSTRLDTEYGVQGLPIAFRACAGVGSMRS